jgi:hypothetical protein
MKMPTLPLIPRLSLGRAPVTAPTEILRVPLPDNAGLLVRQELFGETTAADLVADNISAWFGDHKVLDRVSLTMKAGQVTALIGPSGCGKSTFLRILNRMHEMIPTASLAGEVRLDGSDIYSPDERVTAARRHIGMIFQKPNPFPAMSIYDNVVSGLKLSGIRSSREQKDVLVEDSLRKPPCGTRSRTGSSSRAAGSLAASSSGSASPGRSPCRLACFSWTSRARPSTRLRPGASRRPSSRSAARSRSSS